MKSLCLFSSLYFPASPASHRKASLATSDQDFATVEKKIDILWTGT